MDQDLNEGDVSEKSCNFVMADEYEGEIKVGMRVCSENEAYILYNRYALRMGFSVRKHKKRYKDGTFHQREFVCAKEGFSELENPHEVKKFNRLDARTGCKARVIFTRIDDAWEISALNITHNHELASKEEIFNLRSGRRITSVQGNVLRPMVDSGINPIKSYSFLAKEAGGINNLGFTKRDCHNYLHTMRKEMIEAGDGQSIINHFKCKQAEDPMFFYSIQIDQYSRMSNVFWRDGRSKFDYDYFGDVVIFDTRYRTNQYNLICAPFVGVNHHSKNVLFGCAFLVDETTESFVWLFETFLEAMGNRQPKTIFTDQDQAMSNAIQVVLPEACHQHCLWHISENANQKLGDLYAHPEFKRTFNKCLQGCESVEEFETIWSSMIRKYELENHSWLKRLYEIRTKWCSTFSVDIFSASIKYSQRRESTNSVFHKIMGTTTSLIQLIQYYEEKAEEMRHDESYEDFRFKNCVPAKAARHGGLLGHAAEIYTIFLFKMFEEEFLGCLGLNCVQVSGEVMTSTYQINKPDCKIIHTVRFDRLSCLVCCSCKLFETLGLLCSHALRVLVVNNVNMIPVQYILRRWTKKAKEGLHTYFEPSSSNKKSNRSLCFSELNHMAHTVFYKASMSFEGTKIVKEKLREALEQIEKHMTTLNILDGAVENVEKEVDDDDNVTFDTNDNDKLVLDPPCIIKKGLTNAKIKSQKKRKSNGVSTAQRAQCNHVVSGQAPQGSQNPSSDLRHDSHVVSGQASQGSQNPSCDLWRAQSSLPPSEFVSQDSYPSVN